MKCTDCEYSRETVPLQKNYVRCLISFDEMPAWVEFKDCKLKAGYEEDIKGINIHEQNCFKEDNMVKYELSDLLEDFRRAVQNYATNSSRECIVRETEPKDSQDSFMVEIEFPERRNNSLIGKFHLNINVWDIDQDEPQMSVDFYYTSIKGWDQPAILGEKELQFIAEIRALRRAYRSGK